MIGLSVGHGAKHVYQQGVLLLIPYIKESLRLTDVGVGLIGTARTISSAAGNIPAGIMADMWRSKIALTLPYLPNLNCLTPGVHSTTLSPASTLSAAVPWTLRTWTRR